MRHLAKITSAVLVLALCDETTALSIESAIKPALNFQFGGGLTLPTGRIASPSVPTILIADLSVDRIIERAEMFAAGQLKVVAIVDRRELDERQYEFLASCSGCLNKPIQSEVFAFELTLIAKGDLVRSATVQEMMDDYHRRKRAFSVRLSYRENAVIGALSHGNSSKEVARRLGISVETVQSHTRNAYKKLGVHNRDAAFIKLGLKYRH